MELSNRIELNWNTLNLSFHLILMMTYQLEAGALHESIWFRFFAGDFEGK